MSSKGDWRVLVSIRDVRHGRNFTQHYFFRDCSDVEAQAQARLSFMEDYPSADEFEYLRCRSERDDGVLII